MFTDTHCHIYSEYYEDYNSIVNNAQKKNIQRFINNGCDTKTNKEVLKIAKEFVDIYGAIGIHPEFANLYQETDLDYIKQNLNNKKIIAIGEIGLDYHYKQDNKEQQQTLFKKQLKLAEENNLPVIIHSREATEDTLKVLKEYHVKGIIHSFSGSLEIAREYVKLGFLLGINGVITFKNCKLKDHITNISLDNIVLETDSPYLTPEPLRGHKNEPANISYIAEFVANLYKVDLKKLAKITNQNIKRIFDI